MNNSIKFSCCIEFEGEGSNGLFKRLIEECSNLLKSQDRASVAVAVAPSHDDDPPFFGTNAPKKNNSLVGRSLSKNRVVIFKLSCTRSCDGCIAFDLCCISIKSDSRFINHL